MMESIVLLLAPIPGHPTRLHSNCQSTHAESSRSFCVVFAGFMILVFTFRGMLSFPAKIFAFVLCSFFVLPLDCLCPCHGGLCAVFLLFLVPIRHFQTCVPFFCAAVLIICERSELIQPDGQTAILLAE